MLLCEEMERAVRYFKWRAQWWEDQQCRRHVETALHEGLTAYALEHAIMFWNIGHKCGQRWAPWIEYARKILSDISSNAFGNEATIRQSNLSVKDSIIGIQTAVGLVGEDEEDNGLEVVDEGGMVYSVPPDLVIGEDTEWEEDDLEDEI